MNLTKLRLKEIIKNELRVLLNEQEMPRRFAGMSTAYLAKRGYQWINGSMVHKTKGDVRDVVAIYKASRSGQKAPARKYGAPGSHFTPTRTQSTAVADAAATGRPQAGTSPEAEAAFARAAERARARKAARPTAGAEARPQTPQAAKPDELVGISKGGKPLYKNFL